MRLKRKVYTKNPVRIDKYHVVIMLLLMLFGMLMVALVVFTRLQKKEIEDVVVQYKRHYMFISRVDGSYISDRIYEEAKLYGVSQQVYVEQLEWFPDYKTIDYLNMAIAMDVDGIILEGSDDDELRKSVNRAAELGIPTTTVLSDCVGSRRKSHIGLGDYDLGREYGRLIIQIASDETPEVLLLMNEDAKENEGRIALGIRETLKKDGQSLKMRLRTERLKTVSEDTLWERTKEILSSKEDGPDILICANEKDTEMVYQYLVDYDFAGGVKIIGSGVSETLIKAVRDGEITALVDVDIQQTGRLCVDALDYYIENKSVNEYVDVDNTVITIDNVERYLEDE